MDRLTYKNEREEWCIDKTKNNAIVPCQDGDKRYYIGEPIDRLAELENAIENQKLMEIPQIGDTIWYVQIEFDGINIIKNASIYSDTIKGDFERFEVAYKLYLGVVDRTEEEAKKRLERIKEYHKSRLSE